MPTRRQLYREVRWIVFCSVFAAFHAVFFFVGVYSGAESWYLWYQGLAFVFWAYIATIEKQRPRKPTDN